MSLPEGVVVLPEEINILQQQLLLGFHASWRYRRQDTSADAGRCT
jgi:hypothetical protein